MVTTVIHCRNNPKSMPFHMTYNNKVVLKILLVLQQLRSGFKSSTLSKVRPKARPKLSSKDNLPQVRQLEIWLFLCTDFQESLNTLLVNNYYNDLFDNQSSWWVGMKSHTSMLVSFFLYVPWHYVCRFSRKILAEVSGKFRSFFQKSPQRFFLENQLT